MWIFAAYHVEQTWMRDLFRGTLNQGQTKQYRQAANVLSELFPKSCGSLMPWD